MLDAASLDSITQEARSCFLYEDAPEYLAAFESGLQQLTLESSEAHPDVGVYNGLMRTAHSLKGGAGIAQLPHLQRLSHQLEDLLEALNGGRVEDSGQAHQLLFEGLERTNQLIAAAIRSGEEGEAEAANKLEIFQLLDFFLGTLPEEFEEFEESSDITPNSFLIETALTVDLEDCIQRVEGALEGGHETLEEIVPGFVEECILLGEALNLPWLSEVGKSLQGFVGSDTERLAEFTQTALSTIREQRERLLNPSNDNSSAVSEPLLDEPDFPQTDELNLLDETIPDISDLDELLGDSSAKPSDEPELDVRVEDELLDEFVSNSVSLPVVAEATSDELPSERVAAPSSVPAKSAEAAAPGINLRMPVTRLDKINNILGELLIAHERLGSQHVQLKQANRTLSQRAQQLTPLNERISDIYDRLSSPVASTSAAVSSGTVLGAFSHQLASHPNALSNHLTEGNEFDSLEMDRYTDLHSTLQDFQELMVRVQETRSDIDVIQMDLGESLEGLRQDLDGLRSELTQSRLSPFRTLSDRFFAPLRSLSSQHNKSVSLEVKGADALVDLAVLEQLQAPLTQLFRNAFAHGIEPPEERVAAGKSPEATITLSARVQSNRALLSISDDGRGIDLQAVLDKAIQLGLCTPEEASSLTSKQIYGFLFTPGFSTAEKTTALAGRGVGLDIVQMQVERLRGSVQVESQLGKGTTFTLSIPLSSNILPLLICRCQQRLMAMPSIEVLEAIGLQEYKELGLMDGDRILWKERSLRVKPLLQLLPYAEKPVVDSCPVALIVNVGGTAMALGVDALESERELVLKPFDSTVPMPAYLSGCTVLGDGQVVPVLDTDRLALLLEESLALSTVRPGTQQSDSATPAEGGKDDKPTILIVDDSIAVRRALNRLLTQAGYRVIEGRDGKEALEIFSSSDRLFEMVITDIEMPRLDGFGLLQAIRESNATIPVAMLTSRENERHRRKAFSLGATEYFSKPFQPRAMLQTLEKLLHVQQIEA